MCIVGRDAVSLRTDDLLGNTTEAFKADLIPEVDHEPAYADDNESSRVRSYAPPPPPPPEPQSSNRPNLRRRVSLRRPRGRRQSMPQGNPQVQVLTIPQLDAVQRSLKLLDVRLQHIQSSHKEDDKVKDDIDHVRRVMSENQKAMCSVVTVLASIQEEVRNTSINIRNAFDHPPTPRRKSNASETTQL